MLRPTLCVIAGYNGSGKTTTTEQLLANEWGADSVNDQLQELLYRTTSGSLAKQYVKLIPHWAEILMP